MSGLLRKYCCFAPGATSMYIMKIEKWSSGKPTIFSEKEDNIVIVVAVVELLLVCLLAFYVGAHQ